MTTRPDRPIHQDSARRKRRAYLAAQGVNTKGTAPDRAAARILALQNKGWSLREIERATGTSRCAMRGILHNTRPYIRWETEQKILSLPVQPPRAQHYGVPSLGTARRIQALYAAGHPLTLIAQRCSLAAPFLSEVANGRKPTLSSETVATIRQVYDDLSMKTGPSLCLRTRARNKGWAGPLHWDEEAIDDPAGFPDWTGHCGTAGGWLLHTVDSEEPCPACAPHGTELTGHGVSRVLANACPQALAALTASGRTWQSIGDTLALSKHHLYYARTVARKALEEAA
jgi:hypothetical protein